MVVNVEIGEIVAPNEHLICKDYEGLQGTLCKDDEDEMDVGVICELFCLNEDGIIHPEDIPYDPARYILRLPMLTVTGLSQPDKTEEDYRMELEDFIASDFGRGYYEYPNSTLCSRRSSNHCVPIGQQVRGTRKRIGIYEFDVENLRPGECRWLCRGMWNVDQTGQWYRESQLSDSLCIFCGGFERHT